MSLYWPPLKMPRLAPPKSFKYENHIEVLRHLDFFRSWGGAVWDSDFSFKSFLTGQHLVNSRGWGQLKKHPVLCCHQFDDGDF